MQLGKNNNKFCYKLVLSCAVVIIQDETIETRMKRISLSINTVSAVNVHG